MYTGFDIDGLRVAVLGIELGSFARAASELDRSQSAVSMQLKKLEQQAGVQLFVRKGRGLMPTDAGETLLKYARQIIAMNDDAARALGASVGRETVRLGLPQDFYDDVMPATVHEFTKRHPCVQVAVRAGNNHTIYEDVLAGRLDGAIAFFPKGSHAKGELLCELPLFWIAHEDYPEPDAGTVIPLVLFNNRCLFRQIALDMLDKSGVTSRAALTTPSLAAIWAALRSKFGIGVRVGHSLPDDIKDVSDWACLPSLPPIELRLLSSDSPTPLVQDMIDVLRAQTMALIHPSAESAQ